MSSKFQSEIGGLSAAEKIELIDALWESLETNDQVLTAEQRTELDSRLARHESNPSDVIPWASQSRAV